MSDYPYENETNYYLNSETVEYDLNDEETVYYADATEGYEDYAYDLNGNPIYYQDGSELHGNVGEWSLHSQTVWDMASSISCLEYDNFRDLLWSGSSSGRVLSTFAIDQDSGEIEGPKAMDPFVSFQSSKLAIKNVIPLKDKLVVISEDFIKFHTLGGMSVGTLKASSLPNSTSDSSRNFACGSLINKRGGLVTAESMDPSSILATNTSEFAYTFDINTIGSDGCSSSPLVTYNIDCAPTVSRNNGLYTALGGSDGKIRLIDCNGRSNKVLQTLDGHGGIVNDLNLRMDEVTLLSCGGLYRSNDRLASNIIPDPLIRVFDLRMGKPLPPISMTISSPRYVRFLSNAMGVGKDAAVPLVAMVSASGVIQINQLNGDFTKSKVISVPHCNQPSYGGTTRETVTSVASASSGHFMTAGLSGGAIVQFSLGLSGGSTKKINEFADPVFMPPLKPDPPMLSLPLDANLIGSAYVARSSYDFEDFLASSFSYTPSLLNRKLRLDPTRRVSKAISAKATKRDFIATLTNPGFKPNSMIYGTAAANMAKSAYALCDPRKLSAEDKDDAQSGLRSSSPFMFSAESAESTSTASAASASNAIAVVPFAYRKFSSKNGKFSSFNKFDYSKYNETRLIGLENSVANSYMNAILQFLFAVSDIRVFALKTQSISFYYNNVLSIWCELGFLFHMLKICRLSGDAAVAPTNFQHTLSLLPEVAALGLSEESACSSQMRFQMCILFFLQQLQKEIDLDKRAAASAFDVASSPIELFGFSVDTVTNFLNSKNVERGKVSRVFTLEAVYVLKSNSATDFASISKQFSFSYLLWCSLRKETFARGWCAAAEDYEPCMQRRSAVSLPAILTLLCGDTIASLKYLPQLQQQNSPHLSAAQVQEAIRCCWYTRNAMDGPWLPVEIEIVMLIRGDSSNNAKLIERLVVSGRQLSSAAKSLSSNASPNWFIFDGESERRSDKPFSKSGEFSSLEIAADELSWEISTYNVGALISHIGDDAKSSHCVLELNRRYFDPKSDDIWQIINDFAVTSTSLIDSCSFHPWKHPGVIFMVRSVEKTAKDSNSLMSNAINTDLLSNEPTASSASIASSSSSAINVDGELVLVPSNVFQLSSISQVPCIRVPLSLLPKANDVIALDAEFVSVELGKSEIASDGQRFVSSEGRQIIARVSVISGDPSSPAVIMDDYILPQEPVVDYVTRYSGITEEDLNPGSSRHALVPLRTAYLKLRHLIDCGCIVVGHGLQKDFENANIVVPSAQIRDTVELWRLPNQRKISLRFLASYLFSEEIQGEIHDSIEDAKTALKLLRRYDEIVAKDPEALTAILRDLYAFGNRTNWTIGLDELNSI